MEERNKRENVKKREEVRVYKSVIWSTKHVRGPRSLRRRNKSSTYVPQLHLCHLLTLARTPTPNPPRSSQRPAAAARLFIRELPSLIISPSLFSGVAGRGGTDFPRDLMESPTWKYNSVKSVHTIEAPLWKAAFSAGVDVGLFFWRGSFNSAYKI